MSETETAAVPAGPQWYCPGCGTRYFGPGICTNNHPPTELVQDTETADVSPESAPEAEPGTPTTPAPGPAPAEPSTPAPATEPAPEPTPPPADPVPTTSHAKDLALQAISAAADALHKAAALLSGL